MHRRGLELIRPGVRCRDIADELNEMNKSLGLLKFKSIGYGHSLGLLPNYQGREPGEYAIITGHPSIVPCGAHARPSCENARVSVRFSARACMRACKPTNK